MKDFSIFGFFCFELLFISSLEFLFPSLRDLDSNFQLYLFALVLAFVLFIIKIAFKITDKIINRKSKNSQELILKDSSNYYSYYNYQDSSVLCEILDKNNNVISYTSVAEFK